MDISHKHRYAVSGAAVRMTPTAHVPASASFALKEMVPNNVTDFQIDVGVIHEGLQTFALWASREVTVKTNSASSPDEVFFLRSTWPEVWSGGNNIPIGGDVETLFVTNTSGKKAQIKLIAGWLADEDVAFLALSSSPWLRLSSGVFVSIGSQDAGNP